MIKIILRVVAFLLASHWVLGTSVAQAEPLVPPTFAEIQFLDQARRLLPGSGDPVAFNNDGELLDQGRFVCFRREVSGLVGYNVSLVSPIVTQLAFIYLCPR